VRRIPVIDAHGVLAGLVSQDDLLSAIAGELQALASIAPREQTHERSVRP
jgi:CBS domain containing-hemolysin-like protein